MSDIGIVWIEKFPDMMPGVLFFECERLSACITGDTCRKNWDEAHTRRSIDDYDRRSPCKTCPIGRSLHAPKDDSVAPMWADHRNENECARCGRTGVRIIPSSGECASCFNRRRETERGRSARGRVPQTLTIMRLHRIGLIVDGKPRYRRFIAHHVPEAISQAIRQVDGVKFHGKQPGSTTWNRKNNAFEYRCYKHPGEFGSLCEHLGDNGSIEYVCPVCQPRRARTLPTARVVASTSIQSQEVVAELVSGAAFDVPEGWIPSGHVCNQCHHYQVLVRGKSGRVETRCPMCDAN